MGTYWSNYLGPYLFVVPKKAAETEILHTCINQNCINYNKKNLQGNYCSACGGVIGDKEHKFDSEIKVRWAGDFLGYDDEKFSCPHWVELKEGNDEENYNILLPNEDFYDWNKNTDSVSPDRINLEIKQFKETYKEELNLIIQFFGKENVKFQWGLVHFGS